MTVWLLTLALIVGSVDKGIEACKAKDYEYSLFLLKNSERLVSKQRKGEYYFYRAVAEYQLFQKKEALTSISNVIDSFDPIPMRYKHVAWLMKSDLDKWKDGVTLENIDRKMQAVANRLEIAKGGKETQRQQKEIVSDIDKLIKEEEDKAKAAAAKASGEDEKNKNAKKNRSTGRWTR